jgi:hypothetical protein
VKITIICEGKTEKAFNPYLKSFLTDRLPGKNPALRYDVHNGAIPSGKNLKKLVDTLLATGPVKSDAVIALTEVYPAFADAASAKQAMREAVGDEPNFFPHVALHDFEAWLLPYRDRIQKLAGRTSTPFGPNPEAVNHGNPPAHRLSRLFEARSCRVSYNNPRDAGRILRGADLMTAINACPELKTFVNTIVRLCDKSKVIP